MNKQYLTLIFSLLIFSSSSLVASQLPSKLEVKGDIDIRKANKVDFVKVINNYIDYSDGLILKTRPNFKNQLASDTQVLIGSHTITMFPGALFKIRKSSIIPMLGRIEINTANENNTSLLLTTSKFSCEFCHGKIVIEICPNGDSYIASPRQVKAWIKEHNRKIHILNAGTEIFFPAFGPSKSKRIISSRWHQSPIGYANIDETVAKSPKYENASKTKALPQTSSSDIKSLVSSTPMNQLSLDNNAVVTPENLGASKTIVIPANSDEIKGNASGTLTKQFSLNNAIVKSANN